MFEALFGTEMPLALRFFIAFVVVLGLIGGAAYLVRRFGASALNPAAFRGRQPRLAVIDATPVDSRRRLVLVRRDNVEHLIMIGGPTDVVVEPNIVRAIPAAPQRDTPPARAVTATDNLPRAIPLSDTAAWQPEPPPRPSRAMPAPDDSVAWPLQPEPAPRPPVEPVSRAQEADRIAGLAADLSRAAGEPVSPPPRRTAPPAEPRRAPSLSQSDDQNLAEMAQILESALRRADQSAEPPRAHEPPIRSAIEPSPRYAEPSRRAKPTADPAAPSAPRLEPKPVRPSIEQEMASLLGRPTGKT